jgi:regulator of protease activity HflC (stomatin/prohibitin superfamily)
MILDDVFEKKDDVAVAVKAELNDAMLNYGFDIIKTLVTDIDPDAQVKDSMNRINASEREKVAAQFEGDAQRILIVERAKAEAESKRLQGQGIADQRREIARGLEDSVKVLNGVDINSQEASALIVVTQHYDTLQSVGSASNSNLILMPNSPQAGSEMLNNMVASFTASNQIGEEMKKAKKAKDTLEIGMKAKNPGIKKEEPPMDSSSAE